MKITNPQGLTFNFLENGLVKSISAGPIRINLKEETPFSGLGTQIYLRKKSGSITYTPLLGPESNSQFKFEDNRFIAKGNWSGLDYTCLFGTFRKKFELGMADCFRKHKWRIGGA